MNQRLGLNDEFYVLYCCTTCHIQFKDKESLVSHRLSCKTIPEKTKHTNSGEGTEDYAVSQPEDGTPHIPSDSTVDTDHREPEINPTVSQLCQEIQDHQYVRPETRIQGVSSEPRGHNSVGVETENEGKIANSDNYQETHQVPAESTEVKSLETKASPSKTVKPKRGRPRKTILNSAKGPGTSRVPAEKVVMKVKAARLSTVIQLSNVRKSSRIMTKPRKSYAKLVNFNNEFSSDEIESGGEAWSGNEKETLVDRAIVTSPSKHVTASRSVDNSGKVSRKRGRPRKDCANLDTKEVAMKKTRSEDKLSDNDVEMKCFEAKEDEGEDKYIVNERKDVVCRQGKTRGKEKKEKIPKPPNPEPAKKIIIKLDEHTDKFSIKEFESIAPMDRGKPKEDKTFNWFCCKICTSYKTPTGEAMESHLGQHLCGKLTCKKCGYIASSVSLLGVHSKETHREDHKMIVCELCGREFGDIKHYREHMGVSHNTATFACKKCRQSFLSHKQLKEHRLSDHKNAAFKCDKCALIFISKYYYTKHLDSKACNKDPIQCEHCGCFKKNRHVLQEHVKRVHKKEFTHNCKYCSYSASQNYLMRDHMCTHEGVHPNKCEICPFTCVKTWQLVSHMRTHTGEKKYKCDQCNYAAAWNVQLRSHKKSHLSATRQTCSGCNIVFKDERCLTLHQYKSHREAKMKGLRPNILKVNESKLRNLLQLREVEGTNIVLYEELEADGSSCASTEGTDAGQSCFTLNEFKMEHKSSASNEANYIASWVQVGTDTSGQPVEDLQTCMVKVIDTPDVVE